MISKDPLGICPQDTMDHVERLLMLMAERDRHDRRREREKKKNPHLLTEQEKRVADCFARHRREMLEEKRSQRPSPPSSKSDR